MLACFMLNTTYASVINVIINLKERQNDDLPSD